MRNTCVLYAQHIGRMIRRHWNVQGKIKVIDSRIDKFLSEHDIKVCQLQEIFPPDPKIYLDPNPLNPKEIPLDENHPDWQSESCYIIKDNDLLIEGLDQARSLTNTEEIYSLPPSILDVESQLNIPDYLHREVMRKTMLSCIFDAYQEKLPKRKDPERPTFNFQRDYGITDGRKTKLLMTNFTQICEAYSQLFDRTISFDVLLCAPCKAFGVQCMFEVTAPMLLHSKTELSLEDQPNQFEQKPVPNLYPLHPTTSINQYNFYKLTNVYPIIKSEFPYIHTVFITFNKSEVTNLDEEEVTASQIMGRNLIHGFCSAAAQAYSIHGDEVMKFVKPITVQLIMSDGKLFHFSVLQLKSLDLDNTQCPEKNIYWNSKPIPLYEDCAYIEGRPSIKGYNGDVIKRFLAFYINN